jgi:citrate lyase subunit beta/citryl-CoA lyase
VTRYADHVRAAEALLFVPGDRPERFAKAAASGADLVIIDLEDAVAPSEKTRAREHARAWLDAGNAAMVRINGVDTPWFDADARLVAELSPAMMLPKAESATDISCFGTDVTVVALIETALGLMSAAAIAASPTVHRLAFGSIDLAAQLGVDPSDRDTLLLARCALVTASAAHGLAAPIDGVTTVLDDPQATADDVAYARRLGMAGKLCIHPNQVAAVHRASAPSSADVEWAQRIVAVGEPSGAAIAVDGRMVDRPVFLRASAILAAARRRDTA